MRSFSAPLVAAFLILPLLAHADKKCVDGEVQEFMGGHWMGTGEKCDKDTAGDTGSKTEGAWKKNDQGTWDCLPAGSSCKGGNWQEGPGGKGACAKGFTGDNCEIRKEESPEGRTAAGGGNTNGVNFIASTGGKTIPTDGGHDIPLDVAIKQFQDLGAQRAGAEVKYAGVINATTNGVIEAYKAKGKPLSPEDVKSFGPLLDSQLKAKIDERELREQRREGKISPQEYEARLGEITAAANQAMGAIKSESMMDAFHSTFNKSWEEFKSRQPDSSGWGSGLPARDHINQMLRSNANNPNNWALSGAEKLASGDKAGGMEALNRSIQLGGTPDAFGMRGGLKMEAKDYAGAYKDALEALKLKPGDPALTVLLKSVEGRVSPAERAAIAASVGAGGSAGGAFSNAGAASRSASAGTAGFASWIGGGTSRTVPGMTTPQALASSAKLDEAKRALALGDVSGALALAQRALEINPSNAAAHSFMAQVYNATHDYRRAAASAAAGLALSPRDPTLLNLKAVAQNRLRDYKDALSTSNSAIEADPRGPWGYANRAYAYGGLGDKDSMMHDINRAAEIDPSFRASAKQAADLQLPSNADVLFLFPGEDAPAAAAPAPSPKRSFGFVVAAGLAGGLLLALGLLSTVLAPVKESVVSAFTKATRRGPSLQTLEPATAEPVSVAGEVGGLVRGQYEIVRQIGAGGMGMVYEGLDKSLGRKVAIKKMREELRVNARERERFVIEAKTVAALRHPHVVDIYAIAEDRDDVYLVFEYVEGKTIHDVVQAQGRLRPADASRVTKAIADALAYAHSRGVIHRDVKPSNVMVSPQGSIKVMDFGIARMAKDAMTRYSMTNTVVGTPPYMAPEQEQGVVRKESDVYALAVMSYEMLTGKLPFIGMGAGMLLNKINMSFVAPSRAIAGLPASLDEVFTKAFQADPDNRYRTPQEFSAALDAALGGVRGKA